MSTPVKIGLGLVAVVVVFGALAAGLFVTVNVLQALFDPNFVDPQRVVQCSASSTCSVVWPIVFGLIFVLTIVTGFAYTTLLERKFIAWFQQRVGPNRVGPLGLLQPAADAVKLIFKEDIIPDKADKPIYYLAPLLKTVPALIVLAVVPLGPSILLPWIDGFYYVVPLGLADVNVGVLWLLAITSIGTYGITLAGWASNNKYAMLGGLRASAQMISYELSLGLAMAVPVMIVGSMSLGAIIEAQKYIHQWFVFQNPLAAGILILTLFAEVSRAPFDLVEAEQELTAGFMTEYSGMKFAMFMMAEYIGMIAVGVIVATMYFGGYHFILVDQAPILGPIFLIGKVVLFLIFFIWARATLPRVRYDRLMALGWKVLLPLALLAVTWTAIATVIGDASGSPFVYTVVSGIFFVVVVAGGFYFLRDPEEAKTRTEEADLANDPIVTGERRGAIWTALNVLGGFIAIPFVLVEGLIRGLEAVEKAGQPAKSDETAIVPKETSGGD
ncbi:MAG: NADH-quinone oxidoreductase subunit NuoH [Aggregatilineales bacterium]